MYDSAYSSICILMNTVKECITIHLLLTYMCWKLNTLDDLSNRVCVPNKTRFESKSFQQDCRNK